MEAALITRLNAVPAITGLTGDRISWFDRVRGDGLPALVLTQISPGREYTHDGPDELDRPRVRFDCWADDQVSAKALARAVLTTMESAADVGDVRFWPAELQVARDLPEAEQDGGAALFRVQQEFLFFHETI
jgi:Protein of unknown function (DUF3168)